MGERANEWVRDQQLVALGLRANLALPRQRPGVRVAKSAGRPRVAASSATERPLASMLQAAGFSSMARC